MNIKLQITILLILQNALAICQTWSTLGTGINTEVLCLYSDEDNNLLYAGGEFSLAGGIPANRIAVWNGSVWMAVGSINSNSGAVKAIAKWNGNIYAAGWGLRPTGSNDYSNLVKWDGNSWSHVDLQLSGNTEINALEVYNNELYIAHDNDPGITDTMPGFVKWDGSNIVEVGAGTPRGTGIALLAANGVLYASGKYVYQWNGSSWDTLNIAPYCPLDGANALAYYNGKLIAGGKNQPLSCGGVGGFSENTWWYDEIEGRWNNFSTYGCGSSGVSANGNAAVNALSVYHNELFAGGDLDYAYDGQGSGCPNLVLPSENVAKWTGYNFMGINPGLNYPVNCFAIYNDQLVMGGLFTTSNGAPANHITLHETPTVGRIEFYNSVQNNNFLEKPYLLAFSQSNMYQANTLKICADGTKSTLVKFVKPTIDPNNIRFRIKGDPDGLNPSVSGIFNAADYSISGDTAIVRFTHPKHMPDAGLFLRDTIQVYDFAGGYVLFENPVEFYRAPVILVHGLWSNGDFWQSFDAELQNNGYPSSLTYRASYEGSHASHFTENVKYIPEAIRTIILKARGDMFSCGAADIIAHSMGGILSRLYLQSDEYANNIHKLITVNTPHSGSQAANLLLNPVLGPLLSESATFIGNDCFSGAVEDLRIGFYPVDVGLNGFTLNKNMVPSHAFATHTTLIQSVINVPDWVVVMTRLGAIAATKLYPNPYVSVAGYIMDFPDFLFIQQNNDLVVSEPSQTGGCSKTTSLQPYWHSTWKNKDTAIYFPLLNTLKQAAYNTNYYSQSGFTPPPQTSLFKMQQQNAPVIAGTGEVMFTNISEGDTIFSNQDFTFDIASTGDIQRMMLVISGGTDHMVFADTTAPSASVTLNIENGIFEKARALLVGYDTTGIIDVDTLKLVVAEDPGNACLTLTTYPETLYLVPGQTGSISVNTQCTQGDRNISHSSNISYQLANPSIASNTSDNGFLGLTAGSTYVVVSYSGLNDTVKLVVSDTSYTSFVSAIPHLPSLKKDNIENFVTVYPNPFKDQIHFIVNPEIYITNAEIVLYDVLAREVKRVKNISANNFNIETGDLGDGIYFYCLITQKGNGKMLSGKIAKGVNF